MSQLITMRIPDDLLAEIDGTAKAEGLSRSAVIISILRESGRPVPASVREERSSGLAEPLKRARVKKGRASAAQVEACPIHGQGCGFSKPGGLWFCAKHGKAYPLSGPIE